MLSALAVMVSLSLFLDGCSSTNPAPVSGWDWTGPVPQGYYLVRNGDTLGLVAQRLKISDRKLVKWNRLKPPYTIYADTLLRVEPPDGPSAPRMVKAPGSVSKKTDIAEGVSRSSGAQTAAIVSKGNDGEAAGSRRATSGIPWEWPLNGPLLQGFRTDDRTRQGIRIGGRPGEQVRACADGQVVYSGGGLKGYGNLIIIKHNEKYLSAYGFNRRLFATEGDRVKRGQAVAEVGQGAEGIYLLHFEVRRNGAAVDPIFYLPPRN